MKIAQVSPLTEAVPPKLYGGTERIVAYLTDELSAHGHAFIATLHGRLDLPELQPLYSLFGDVPVVSISDSQREPLPQANYARPSITASSRRPLRSALSAPMC